MARIRPEDIAAALRLALRERVFEPGQALNQDELAHRFGVSRIPVREAMRTLVGEGLIVMKVGLGAIVAELNAAEVDELYGLRLRLEPPLALPIIERLRPTDLSDLTNLSREMAKLDVDHAEDWSNLNYRFQRRLYELSDRKHTVRLVVQVLNLVEPYARVHAHVLGSRSATVEQRTTLLDALRRADSDTLQALIAESIDVARSELGASMAAPSPDPYGARANLRL